MRFYCETVYKEVESDGECGDCPFHEDCSLLVYELEMAREAEQQK